jgi:hypothetical protein
MTIVKTRRLTEGEVNGIDALGMLFAWLEREVRDIGKIKANAKPEAMPPQAANVIETLRMMSTPLGNNSPAYQELDGLLHPFEDEKGDSIDYEYPKFGYRNHLWTNAIYEARISFDERVKKALRYRRAEAKKSLSK